MNRRGRLDPAEVRRACEAGRDVCIRGGVVADGTGGPLQSADVLVARGKILAVGAPGSIAAPEALELDAVGQVVAPGFIDVHSHADNAPLLVEDDTTKILQGVTTEVVGNCGFSLAPVQADRSALLSALLGRIFPRMSLPWSTFAELFAITDVQGYVTNYVPLVGHSTLRLAALGMTDRAATDDELKQMQVYLDRALADGVFGLSSGLIYPPGMFGSTTELVALARVLGPERIYATHMRGEGAHLLESITEALAIADQASCRVQISHLKASGRANWGSIQQALEMLRGARDRSLAVRQDVYPYTASSTMLTACLPPWFQEEGNEGVMARLKDSDALARARADITDGPQATWENHVYGAGWDGILIASTASHGYEGRTLTDIADQLSIEPFDAMVRILLEENLRASMVLFSMNEADVEAVLRDPHTMVGSDGLPPGVGGRPHPRLFGTFPRVLGRYVRERKTLSLPTAIAKMTSLPADTFRLAGRGRVAPGLVGDLVVFSPETICDIGSYADPVHSPVGISAVLVDGRPVVFEGEWLGSRRGQRLTA